MTDHSPDTTVYITSLALVDQMGKHIIGVHSSLERAKASFDPGKGDVVGDWETSDTGAQATRTVSSAATGEHVAWMVIDRRLLDESLSRSVEAEQPTETLEAGLLTPEETAELLARGQEAIDAAAEKLTPFSRPA